jgi:hypothetical protein
MQYVPHTMPPQRGGFQRVLLLVEPNPTVAARIAEPVEKFVTVHHHRHFESARAEITDIPFNLLLANVRLGEFNGLHLFYIARSIGSAPAIVYTESREPGMGREIQRCGAFYETAERLPVTLRQLMFSTLPAFDRRDAESPDRRNSARGGRRAWDQYVASA